MLVFSTLKTEHGKVSMPALNKSLRDYVFLLFVACAPMMFAQQPDDRPKDQPTDHADAQSTALPHPAETVVVLGSAVPVPLAESPRSVLIEPLRQDELLLATPLDPLRNDASVFL